VAVVLGAAALPAALFIAAHEAEVFLLDHDLASVEGAESRAVSEQLAGRFQALVVTFGGWFPDVAPGVAGIDPAALAPAPLHGHQTGASARHGGTRVGVATSLPSSSRRHP